MSTEVYGQAYLYVPTRRKLRAGRATLYAPARPEPLPGQTSQETVVPFMHNPLHDLESIFWLSLYLLLIGQLKAIKGKSVVLSADQQNAQHNVVGALFGDPTFRCHIMCLNVDILEQHMEGVHPSLVYLAEFLIDYRYHLYKAFVKAERNLVNYIPFTVAQTINDDLDQVMKDICEGFGKEDILVDNRVEASRPTLPSLVTAPNDEEDGRPAKRLKTETGNTV